MYPWKPCFIQYFTTTHRQILKSYLARSFPSYHHIQHVKVGTMIPFTGPIVVGDRAQALTSSHICPVKGYYLTDFREQFKSLRNEFGPLCFNVGSCSSPRAKLHFRNVTWIYSEQLDGAACTSSICRRGNTCDWVPPHAKYSVQGGN